jgi:hypothetical protein
MRDVEQVRKQLSTLYGDARRAMLGGGSGADVHALEHITEHFDARVRQMVADGKFSGDGPAVLKCIDDARASFADYKQKFARAARAIASARRSKKSSASSPTRKQRLTWW